jgi:PAS domain S-box-containing protein
MQGALAAFGKKESVRDFINCNIHKDGRRRIISTSGFPILDSKNNFIGYRGINVDITERQKAVDDLKISETKFRNIVEGTKAILFNTNRRGIFTYLNEAACDKLGMKMKDLTGKFYLKFIHPESRTKTHSIFTEQLANPKPNTSTDVQITTKSGEEGWLSLLINPIYNEGKVVGLTSVALDITDRKKAEKEINRVNEQLVKLNAEKDKFFSIISHDLKSPFNGFLNLTELMANSAEMFTIAEFTENSNLLNKSARNLYKLLENLLDWAQVKRGSIIYTPKDIDLSKLVLQGIDTINSRAVQKGITILNDAVDVHNIYADEKMISTILRNLLSNAVKFTRTGGKVIVNSERFNNGTTEVSITDDGVGISEKDVTRLFKIEEKVGSIGTDNESSTGLGLVLCKEFIEMHGGKIWVESEKGKGSIFHFTIPVFALKSAVLTN